MRSVVRELFSRWPTCGDLARADVIDVALCIRPCGLHRQRARQLTRFSSLFLGDGWTGLHDLPGVGVYVYDCVNVFCFGADSICCNDHALKWYLESRAKEPIG
jgi:endonuclease III